MAITLAVPLALVRACHSTKLLACDVRGCGWIGLKERCGILGVLYAFCYVLAEVRDRMRTCTEARCGNTDAFRAAAKASMEAFTCVCVCVCVCACEIGRAHV